MNILLILGGWSSEREVSLKSGAGIERALAGLGHTVVRFDPATSLDGLLAAASSADFAFIALHGSPGEDGLVQAMLETAGCPYQGAGPAGSFLALNKAAAKEIFRRRGLLTPDWVLLSSRPAKGWKPPFPFPVFIKGNTGGSSLRMERAAAAEDLEGALDRLFAFGGEYLVEPSVQGLEVTCGILGFPDGAGGVEERALPPVLIKPKAAAGAYFDYLNKYTPGVAEELCPAPLPEETLRVVRESALAAHRALGLSDYSRADFIVREQGDAVLLEVNTLPGMTATSLLPQAAAAVGLSFEQLVDRLVQLGLRRQNPAARARA
ncbi:MAG: D-alanine--D-alanine ligase [Deltaproteobacteria bacterium]|jgi:D-alanine-D-alanine ligase|nr:D-alanine--D-alanine ligase [Deltaproteobacteria bacterium]